MEKRGHVIQKYIVHIRMYKALHYADKQNMMKDYDIKNKQLL